MTQTHDQQFSTHSDKHKGSRGPKSPSGKQIEERQAAENATERFQHAVQGGLEGMEAWWRTVATQPQKAVVNAIAGKWASLEPILRDQATLIRHMGALPFDMRILLQLSLSVALHEQDADTARLLLVKACNAMPWDRKFPQNYEPIKAFQKHLLRGGSPALTKFNFSGSPSLEIKGLLACVAAAAFPHSDRQDATPARSNKGMDKHTSQDHEAPLLQWLLKSGLFAQLNSDQQKRAAARAALWPNDTKKNFIILYEAENPSHKLPPDFVQALRAETVQAVKETRPAREVQDQPAVPMAGSVSDPVVVTVEMVGAEPPTQFSPERQAAPPAVKSVSTAKPTQPHFESPVTLPIDVIPAPLVERQVPSDISVANLLLRADELRQLLQAFAEAREKASREAADQLNAAQEMCQTFRNERDLELSNRLRVEEENGVLRHELAGAENALKGAHEHADDLRNDRDQEKLHRTGLEEENGRLRQKLADAETATQDAQAQAVDLRQQVTRLSEELTAALQQGKEANERLTADEDRHRQSLQDLRERFERDKRGEVQVFKNGVSDKLRLEWREFHAGEGRPMDAESGASLRKFVQRMFDMLEREGLRFRK